jgi:uncharacterized protein
MSMEQTVLPKEKPDLTSQKIIGLISDTHVPSRAKSIPPRVFKIFEKADFIIHAGDLVELSVIDELEAIAPVLAVSGNMDAPNVNGSLPEMESMKIFDWRIGVMHDPNALWGDTKMRYIAKENGFHVFVYGHTHCASIKWEDGVLFINPGSPISPASENDKPTVALLKITKDGIVPEIVPL